MEITRTFSKSQGKKLRIKRLPKKLRSLQAILLGQSNDRQSQMVDLNGMWQHMQVYFITKKNPKLRKQMISSTIIRLLSEDMINIQKYTLIVEITLHLGDSIN